MYWLYKEINIKNSKFEIVNTVRMSKYKNIFEKVYTPNCSKRFLWLKKLKILSRWHMLLMILMEKKLLEYFRKIKCKKNKKEFRIRKAIKRKDDKLFVNFSFTDGR